MPVPERNRCMRDRVLELLEQKEYAQVKAAVVEMHEVDIAELFEELEERDVMLRLFRLLPKELAAEAFSYMESDVQQRLIETMTDNELRSILDEIYLDDYVDLVEEMPANVVRRVMQISSRENRGLINQYLKYPEDSAGSLMTNEYVYLKRMLTVQQAIETIRNNGFDKETLYTCYVIDRDRKLVGSVGLRSLILSDPDCRVEELMHENPIHAHTLDDQESVAKLFSRYDMLALPVVDNEERLVGIITIDDAVDVMEEEVTEDFEKMAAMAPSEDSYMKTSPLQLAKNRIGWLLILMISAMFTGLLLEHYEAAISSIPLLVSFIPMLMGTGGNCGNQSSTLVIRSLALDEIELSDWWRVWWKEFQVALLCSVVLALVNFLRIVIQYHDFTVALTVSLTMIVTVVVAKSMGCMLPILARRFKLDPAIMAAPILTTISDTCSILVFFFMATRLLGDRL